MNTTKKYKIRFHEQNQKIRNIDGYEKLYKKKNASITINNAILKDMGITADEADVIVHYDESQKIIVIQKA